MMLLLRSSIQLSVESLIAMRSATPRTLEHLQEYFHLITGHFQFDCFDRSVYSVCAVKVLKSNLFYQLFMSNVMMNNNYLDNDCGMESLLLQLINHCSKNTHITFLLKVKYEINEVRIE